MRAFYYDPSYFRDEMKFCPCPHINPQCSAKENVMEKELVINGVKYVAVGNTLPCQKEWEERKKADEEGSRLCNEGNKILDEAYRKNAEDHRRRAESDKLFIEGKKISNEADAKFYDAVIKHYGKDASIGWIGLECRIENDIYK